MVPSTNNFNTDAKVIRNSVSEAMPHLLTIIYFNEAAQRSFWYRDIVNAFKGKHILEDGKTDLLNFQFSFSSLLSL